MYQINLSTLGIVFGVGLFVWLAAMAYYTFARCGGMVRVVFCLGALVFALGMGSLTLSKADWAKFGQVMVGVIVAFIVIGTLALVRRNVFRRPRMAQQTQIIILFVLVLALLLIPAQTRTVIDSIGSGAKLIANAASASGVGHELVKASERYEDNVEWSLVSIKFDKNTAAAAQ